MTTFISKNQLFDYVTKREFGDFVQDMHDFKDITLQRFDSIDARFVSIESRLKTIDKRLGSHESRMNSLERKFDEFTDSIRIQMGANVDQFRSDLLTAIEFLKPEADTRQVKFGKNRFKDK
jgi:hypothetical protein